MNNSLPISLSAFLVTLLFTAGCTQRAPGRQVTPSFYYWKSAFTLSQPELQALDSLHVQRLYIKFFDVAWNAASAQPLPQAVTRFPRQQQLQPFTIIPAVFITNESLERMDTQQVLPTAANIIALIDTIAARNHIARIPEIQVDCDWNVTTKEKYFSLLTALRQLAAARNRKLSATIRLYQCKYSGKTGVPPVDRGLLMCYNMGNLQNPSVHNSILETHELKKYVSGLSGYPLALDVALPLFGWKVLFRKNRYAGLIRELPRTLLTGHPAVRQSGNRFEFLQPTSINGYTFEPGDLLRDEQVNPDDVIAAAGMVGNKLDAKPLTAALYHLDSLTLSKFSVHELETIFDHLR